MRVKDQLKYCADKWFMSSNDMYRMGDDTRSEIEIEIEIEIEKK